MVNMAMAHHHDERVRRHGHEARNLGSHIRDALPGVPQHPPLGAAHEVAPHLLHVLIFRDTDHAGCHFPCREPPLRERRRWLVRCRVHRVSLHCASCRCVIVGECSILTETIICSILCVIKKLYKEG